MRKIHLSALLIAAAFLFAACNKEEQPTQPKEPGEVVVMTEPMIDGIPESEFITIEDERITITSLALWDDFNFDGNFSDNCLQFLRNFIEHDSEFLEFNTVQVSNWEIIRDPEMYGYKMAFNFTVTESALDTLPAGEYRTIVTDSVDCYMDFEGENPAKIDTVPESEAVKSVQDWILSSFRWQMPAYGESTDPMRYVNYLVSKYGKNGKILYSDLNELMREKAGIAVQAEDLQPLLTVEDDNLYVMRGDLGGVCCFVPVADTAEGDVNTVTIQFFADCNKFIKSVKVEYRISDDGKLLGSTVIEKSPYKPYGLQP